MLCMPQHPHHFIHQQLVEAHLVQELMEHQQEMKGCGEVKSYLAINLPHIIMQKDLVTSADTRQDIPTQLKPIKGLHIMAGFLNQNSCHMQEEDIT